jgi:hypothetical protein
MTGHPDDLLPLPAFGWETRPSSVPLDVEECRTALWLHRGNVTNAASRLKVSPGRLRHFVNASPRLQRECKEAREQLVDLAEDILHEALTDYNGENPGSARRDNMARYVMNSSIAEARGLSSRAPKISVNVNKPIVYGWFGDPGFPDGEGSDAQAIEHDSDEPMNRKAAE